MAREHDEKVRIPANARNKSNWGARLFFAALFAALIFFWWLLIYSGGALEPDPGDERLNGLQSDH